MKFIFDFDDVLFNNTKQFKEHMYLCLKKADVPRELAEEYYKSVRAKQFWLKELLAHFSVPKSWYEKILKESKNFTNKKLLKVIKKLGKNFYKDYVQDAYSNNKIPVIIFVLSFYRLI